jgi:DnaJ-class molecular chaperone
MGCCNSRQDYYSILGITEEASKEDIKIGYSQVTSQPNITNEENREYLNKCTEAYFVLIDPEKKRNYDDFLEGKIENFDSGFSDENTIDIYNSFQKEMEKKEKLEKLEKEFNNKKEMLKKERKNLGIERKKSFYLIILLKILL